VGFISDFFNLVLINPLINLFVLLSALTGNAGFGVILLTLIIRFVTWPLTLKQMHSTRAMAMIAPRQQELQRRYKDPRRRQEEMMKLYREAGINPLGCFSSMLLQFPILIALYRTFVVTVGEAPEALIKLSERLYPVDFLRSAVPLDAHFLWLHLGRPDPLFVPILVAATTFIYQKMSMLPAVDERQRAQNSMMNMLMPLIFGYITITLPSGLGLYYVLSNLIGMGMQYLYVGRGPFNWKALLGLSDGPVLPRALENRQKQQESFNQRLQRGDLSPRDEDQPGDDGGAGNGARTPRPPRQPSGQQANETSASRRRRYASGRRRGRR
jgi:YidC/Oxa1 family membrane protein insertase